MLETAYEAVSHFVDAGSFQPRSDELTTEDPLRYPGYEEARTKARTTARLDESVIAGPARIAGHEVELACFDFAFLGGSMGAVAGERIARAMEGAAARSVPFVLRTSTGGARMQEGMGSLVQIPKMVAARLELADAGQPFIALLGHPTTGGVLAGLASLADVTIGEHSATIGFAGPRVVQRFTGSPPGPDSHTAETAYAHGLVDAVASPSELRAVLQTALEAVAPDRPIPTSSPEQPHGDGDIDAWEAVKAVRSEQRLFAPDLLRRCCDALFELRGDRAGMDDRALTAALVRIKGRRSVALALDRSIAPSPAAYRKAVRSVEIAERLRVPVVSLIDMRGANPSSESENAGIAWAIGSLFQKMMTARVPVLAVVTGEGGSGGALAFATADAVVAYQASIFSVIGPEAAAEILWRDGDRAPEAARLLRVTAADLQAMGIADAIVSEPLSAESLSVVIAYHLDSISDGSPERRRERWRHIDARK